MSHVDFKKWQCRPVEFKGQGPQTEVLYADALFLVTFTVYVQPLSVPCSY